MVKALKLILFILGIWMLGAAGPIHAAVDVYLTPTQDTHISGGIITYNITLQADQDTKLEAIGDIFLAYDKDYLTLITANVKDLTVSTNWTDQIIDLDYTATQVVTGSYAVIRFAKVSLEDVFSLTANIPVQVLTLPFVIDPQYKNAMTRLYFPKALMIDTQHANVLRKAEESFLIRKPRSDKGDKK